MTTIDCYKRGAVRVVQIKGKGSEIGERAGAHALSLLAVPLNVHALQSLAEEPRALVDLRRASGSPPQTTMRGHLRALEGLGLLGRQRRTEFPGTVDYRLTPAGAELLSVSKILQAWLLDAPDGPLLLGSMGARSAVKALVDGWSSSVVRALAAKPLALTDLNRLIPEVSYPSLERRLSAMRLAGQIEPCTGSGRSRPYRVTEWLRRAVAPLAAAAGWERRFIAEHATPIGRLDIEAAFLLAVALLALPRHLTGSCRLGVDSVRGSEHRVAGVLVKVREGELVTCTSRLHGEVDAAVTGSAPAWLRAVFDQDPSHLDLSGDSELAAELIANLHGTFSGATPRP